MLTGDIAIAEAIEDAIIIEALNKNLIDEAY